MFVGVNALQPRLTWKMSRPLKEALLMDPLARVYDKSKSAVLALQLMASPAASSVPVHTPSLAQPELL